jgi:hypothetical protein
MKGKYIITSAQAMARPNNKFIKSLEGYCDMNQANLLILPMIGKSASEDLDQLHDRFKDFEVVYDKPKLNSNIQIEQFNVRPYQIDPITGLNRFAQKGTSLIFASPKQRLRTVPHSNQKLPKFLMTTGACTHPNYATGMDVSAERRRLGNIATRDHILGGLVVEIEDNEKYHFRHIRSTKQGQFVDLGLRYTPEDTRESRLEALVLGDWHNGQEDPLVRSATIDMINTLKPQKLFLHDFFDGHSVNHHSDKRPIREKLLQYHNKGLLSLENELESANKVLWELSDLVPNVYVVASNHNEFLDRYIEEARYVKDIHNLKPALAIASAMAQAEHLIAAKYGMELFGALPKNVHFLKREDDFKVRGYQLASHGDMGAGGSRGSITGKENDYSKSITGHTHNAQILRDTYIVGTMLPLNQFYTRGQPSNWTNTHGAIWDNGSVQLLNIIDGKWKQ